MVAQKLRVIQSNEMGFPSAVGDVCWSGLKSFTAKEEKSGSTLRKTLFILKRSDGLRDFAVFDSVFNHFRDTDSKYVFEIVSVPIVLRDQDRMVHLMSRKDVKLVAVELVEKFGEVKYSKKHPLPHGKYAAFKEGGTMKQLIIHPGAGKTATTSIQKILQNQKKYLIDQGVGYLGMSFENTQTDNESDDADNQLRLLKHRLGREINKDPDGMAEFCSNRINCFLKANPNTDTLIWSNESLANQHGWIDKVRDKLISISEIKTIYGIRDPSSWVVSAYFQWGGDADFKDFVLKRSLANPGKAWRDKSDKFNLLDIDNCENPVMAFLDYVGCIVSSDFGMIKLNSSIQKTNFSKQRRQQLSQVLSDDESLRKWVARESVNIKDLLLLIK
jgi:hypothetical protein